MIKSRRDFLRKIIGITVIFPIIQSCVQSTKKMLVLLTGTNHILGHRIWSKNFPKISETIEVKYLIIGGGISGLSAARRLVNKDIKDFKLLELESHVGGNSSNGENKYSKYPRGAHYLPLPNIEDKELINFLVEQKIIVGFDNGKPIFDEFQLSFPPQERLYYNGDWQEDLVPKKGISNEVQNEFIRFFGLMNDYRTKKDSLGKYYFDIPIIQSSSVEEVKLLDLVTMKEWLLEHNFHSEQLHWYVNYSCCDDFGIGIDLVSAWAGIHYFAGRKQNSANNKMDNVLTWPEGNAHLAHLLASFSSKNTIKNNIVYDVKWNDDKVEISSFNSTSNQSIRYVVDKVIVATPQFINQYLIEGRKELTKAFNYAPWIVSAITISESLDNGSFPLAWDNVIYGGVGVGYVYNQNQNINQQNDIKVISYYLPFSNKDFKSGRRKLYSKSESYWTKCIIEDISLAHPNIEEFILSIEIFRLGHGMISPVKGFIFSKEKLAAAKPIDNKIFFAHSDLSGISIFEEAFHQGIRAADQMINFD
ncbi:NAD(P)-binding protein [Rhizosphaericola mali]|uniref:NAD(P)-binding protein n=2 Tax=Rhizosphaericola mali TaxID=2545455 RepID=A0A5P2G992_9BACT|nr:NAD(P)-binding protein [Rhizosphaericola mali]